MNLNAQILLEHGPADDLSGGSACCFQAPREVILAQSADEFAPALARAEALRREGFWLAGYIAYEAGYLSEPRLRGLLPQNHGPLLQLGVFDGPQEAGPLLERMMAGAEEVAISEPAPLVTRESYNAALEHVLAYIAAGDCYQVNLTFPLQAGLLSGSAEGLYGRLRRSGPVGHGAFVDLGQGPVIVSRSPELFFRLDAGGRITTRPMKGTRPRDADPARDAALAADLQAAVKDRAENLMIVDLLRNDISRLCRMGSVKTPSLFAIEHYATVHQMVSQVEGQLSAPASLPGLISALFPCGSVTGAPKIRAMEIIRELEPHPRGVYCGAIGWMAPDGRADFSVAIRTLSLEGAKITLNVGGGVVHGSTAEGEWEEALWKARFVRAAVSRA